MTCPVHTFDRKGLVGLGTKAQNPLEPSDRRLQWKAFEAERTPFYGPYSRKAKEMRDEVTGLVLEELRDLNTPVFFEGTVNSVVRSEAPGKVRTYLRDLQKQVGQRFSARSFEAIRGKQDIVDEWFAEVDAWLQSDQAGADIRRITSTMQNDITDIIAEAREEGLGSEEIAMLIEQEMDEINRRRARVIARTEVITASNRASQFGAKKSGLALEKSWLDSNDSRVRISHRVVDNQTVDIEQMYQWESPESGTVEARYPGDPSLPAAERIQCRCTETYSRK